MPRLCTEPTCVVPLLTTSRQTHFCSIECKSRSHNRNMVRGVTLWQVGRLWRFDTRKSYPLGQRMAPLLVSKLPLLARPLDPHSKTTSARGAMTRLIAAFLLQDQALRAAALRDAPQQGLPIAPAPRKRAAAAADTPLELD